MITLQERVTNNHKTILVSQDEGCLLLVIRCSNGMFLDMGVLCFQPQTKAKSYKRLQNDDNPVAFGFSSNRKIGKCSFYHLISKLVPAK